MDIGSRNFIEVMKDLSSQTGIELPKDNKDSNRLKYKREAKPKPVAASPAKLRIHLQIRRLDSLLILIHLLKFRHLKLNFIQMTLLLLLS